MKTKGQTMLSNFILLIIFLVIVSVGGLIAGVIYYDMNLLQTELLKVNFDIPFAQNSTTGGTNITDLQDIFGVIIYPILGLKDSLPYLTYFMIFAFIIALGISAYLTSKNPVFFVLHLLFTVVITYFSIILSNTYKSLLTNVFINELMINFVIYNKLMLYLPQIVLFTSLLFGVISFISIVKPQSNLTGNQYSLNYGGDY